MSAYIPAATKRAVRERFGNRCAHCRTAEELTATHFEIEHIDPRSSGGERIFCKSVPFLTHVQPIQGGSFIGV